MYAAKKENVVAFITAHLEDDPKKCVTNPPECLNSSITTELEVCIYSYMAKCISKYRYKSFSCIFITVNTYSRVCAHHGAQYDNPRCLLIFLHNQVNHGII